MTNRFRSLTVIYWLLCSFAALSVSAAENTHVIVGVNAWYRPANTSPEELIKQLGENQVRTVRIGLSDKSLDFIFQAYRNKIGAVVIAYPS